MNAPNQGFTPDGIAQRLKQRDVSRTYEHEPLCDDNGWAHFGPCVIETDFYDDEGNLIGSTPNPPKLECRPITLRAANAYIVEHHRHHGPVRGHKFSIGAFVGAEMVGVVCVGRPVARMLDDGLTAEVTRLCTRGHENACSKLYAAAWRACKAMGYLRCVTYILATEHGASLRAAGWVDEGPAGGGSWSRPSRGRGDSHPLEAKHRWRAGEPTKPVENSDGE